ncbi:hypothetical protein SI65_09538 [Aspergillus cristatus]|uniref:Uncharacterized protein n=1 Tax=Aspergillus cristatus TaxID=573508 RepID=A0A1E3B276_ASPCR|nr:hypothetical protein SI65_09538 [Aspergillus cristatus]
MPSGGRFYKAAKPAVPDRLEASIFSRDIVPLRMLHSLKFLEIVFPPADLGYISLRSPAHQDWVETTSYVEDKLNLSRLTLRVYFHGFRSLSDATPHRRSVLTREEGMQTTISMYELIASPLSQLGNRLGRCFVHAAWPWAWTPEGVSTMRNNIHEVKGD